MRARPEFVRLANRIAGARRPLGFQWNGQPAQFSFSNQRLAPRGGWTLGMQLGGHGITAELNRLPDVAWVSPTLVGIDLHSLPPELVCGLIEATFGEIFDALSKAGVDVKITSVSSFSFKDAPEETIDWCLNRGGETGWMRGCLAGSDAALEHLAGLMQLAPVEPALQDSDLPVPLSLVAGSLPLSLAELQQLDLHDVLLADLGGFISQRHCQLRAGKTVMGAGIFENNAFTLKQLNAAKDTTVMGTAANSTQVNDLDIELTFVVGQSSLTVGSLRSLAPGFVFELSTPASDGVTICANGKPIAKGELLDVGGRTGVRVTEFFAP